MNICIKDYNCYLDDEKQYQKQFQDTLIKTYFPTIVLDNNGDIIDCFDCVFDEYFNNHYPNEYMINMDIDRSKKERRISLELSNQSMHMLSRYDNKNCILLLEFYEYEDHVMIQLYIHSKNILLSFKANGRYEELEDYANKVLNTVDNILEHKTIEINNLRETLDMIL